MRVCEALAPHHRPAFLRAALRTVNGMDCARVEELFREEMALADARHKANGGG